MRLGNWRFSVAPSDDAEKNCNIDAQRQSIACTNDPKMFWKIYFLYDFWCAQLVHSEPFLDYLYENLTLALNPIGAPF